MNVLLIIITLLSVCTLTLAIEYFLLPILKRKAGQPIYLEGPSWHASKQGTPTMGGLAFVASICMILVAALLFLYHVEELSIMTSVIISLLYCLCNSIIGIADDLTKLRKKKNAGLTPLQKILLQLVLATLFLIARKHFLGASTSIRLPFGSIDMGMIYYPAAIVLLLGIINCANLTDGVDGLASSTGLTVGLVFLILGYESTEIGILSSALIGGCLAFLLFNVHPAKIFMGDTGSLFIGAITCSLAFSTDNPFLVIPIGAVYVIEGVSVILQVAVYKATKRRLFLMAPIHHHLEKSGIDENRICIIAVITTLIFSAAACFLIGG